MNMNVNDENVYESDYYYYEYFDNYYYDDKCGYWEVMMIIIITNVVDYYGEYGYYFDVMMVFKSEVN
jgi:hypothetical protein